MTAQQIRVYAKAAVAAIGIIVMVGTGALHLVPAGAVPVVQSILGVLTVAGVWITKNEGTAEQIVTAVTSIGAAEQATHQPPGGGQ